MEAFSSLPAATQHKLSTSNNDEDASYLSLSQFDVELQQQAQLAMQQEIEAWQDFENYLPPVNNHVNFNQTTFVQQYNHHTHQTQPVIDQQLVGLNAANKNNNNNNNNNNNLNLPSSPQTVSSGASSHWTTPPVTATDIKLEYASPEHIAFTSPSSEAMQSIISPFGSPEQHTLYQHSPISTYTNTPLETPLHSPKHDIFANSMTFRIQQQNSSSSSSSPSSSIEGKLFL